jgi:hypothetical protein
MSLPHGKDRLIERPQSPSVVFGRQLGRDEAYAAVFAAITTGIAWFVLDLVEAAGLGSWHALAVPLVAPLLEKPGLIAHYVGEAVVRWRSGRGTLKQNLRRSLCDGRAFRTVRADILFHDPGYVAAMALGVWLLDPHDAAGAALLSLFAFLAALALAAVAEVAMTEASWVLFERRMRRLGFARDPFWETRYLIAGEEPWNSADNVLARVADRFSLKSYRIVEYEDRYHTSHGIPAFNGREPTIRIRTVRAVEDPSRVIRCALQVVHTRAAEIGKDDPSLFRCFAIRKVKHTFAGSEAEVGAALSRLNAGAAVRTVLFRRGFARDPAGLLVSVDIPSHHGAGSEFWIECKVRDDLALLKQANEFVATHFPVRGTTRGKLQLACRDEEAG